MKLFGGHNKCYDGTREWHGRVDNYRVFISEVFNEELGYVDKYSYHIVKSLVLTDYDSAEHNEFYDTVEDCKNAALRKVEQDKLRLSQERKALRKVVRK